MRQIEVEDGLRVRFPGRDAAFDEGVEIGLLLALMASGRPRIGARIAEATLEQARDLGSMMGYRLVVEQSQGSFVEITCSTGQSRPKLALVASERCRRGRLRLAGFRLHAGSSSRRRPG